MSETHTVSKWETHPYTSWDKQSWAVFHRVRFIVYEDTVMDVILERRIPNEGITDWSEVDRYEIRDGRVTHVPVRGGVFE